MRTPIMKHRTATGLSFRCLLILAWIATGVTSLLAADNWPRWRGPADRGSNEAGAYPVKWGASANVLWKIALPGKGCSTPIVWDRRIYLTTPADGQDSVSAIDWDGKPLWQTRLGTAPRQEPQRLRLQSIPRHRRQRDLRLL